MPLRPILWVASSAMYADKKKTRNGTMNRHFDCAVM
jgi:hypothetical protein